MFQNVSAGFRGIFGDYEFWVSFRGGFKKFQKRCNAFQCVSRDVSRRFRAFLEVSSEPYKLHRLWVSFKGISTSFRGHPRSFRKVLAGILGFHVSFRRFR